jgi:hypothetical protein
MNNQDFIPETDASRLAGVSATTLSRFVEAGYLRVQNDMQGYRNYSKSEICKLFAIDAENPQDDSYLSAAVEVTNGDVSSYYSEAESEIPAQGLPEQEEAEEEKVYWADTVSATQGERTEPRETEESIKDRVEITRLRNITVMQDKILEMRENEIEELRKEREWLRTRVEKLEEKSERDQILLLAETQTIKRLVSITHQKKPSSMRMALEWFGILPPEKPIKDIQINNSKIIE